jgi:hypothetical protein
MEENFLGELAETSVQPCLDRIEMAEGPRLM